MEASYTSANERMPLQSNDAIGSTGLLLLRVASAVLTVVVATAIIYTCVTDGSPFRMELLTPWMSATLVDFYGLAALNFVVLVLAEDTLAMGLVWCVLVATLGAGVLWLWVLQRSVFVLSERDPWARLLLSKDRIKGLGYTRA